MKPRLRLALAAVAGLWLAMAASVLAGGALIPAGSCGDGETRLSASGPPGAGSAASSIVDFDGCTGTDPINGEQLFIWASQGADPDGLLLLDQLAGEMTGSTSAGMPSQQMAGRTVYSAPVPGADNAFYFFAAGPVVYIIEAPSAETVARAIRRLSGAGPTSTPPVGPAGNAFAQLGEWGAPAQAPPLASTIPGPGDISLDPAVIATSAALAAAIALAVPFPSALFNNTLEANYEAVTGWTRRFRRGAAGIGRIASALFRTQLGVLLYLIVAAALYGLLDPTFGWDLRSGATLIGLALGILIVASAHLGSLRAAHRLVGDRGRLAVYPAGLLVAAGCVLVTRLTEFAPGYLYGLVVGYAFTRPIPEPTEGAAQARGAVVSLFVAVAAFFGLWLFGDQFGATPPLILLPIKVAMAVLVVAGIEDVLFGLMPLRFMPGQQILAWSRIGWFLLFGLAIFAFLHVLLNPASGYLASATIQPLAKVIALFVGFGVFSVAFWAYFRFRKSSPGRTEP